MTSRPGSDARRRAQAAILDRATWAQEQMPKRVQHLRELLHNTNSMHLYGAIHTIDGMRRTALQGQENFGSDAMVDFLGGLITSMPEEDVVAHLEEGPNLRALYEVDTSLRDVGNLLSHIDSIPRPAATGTTMEEIIHSLRLEHHFDRMAGFDTHLHVMVGRIFSEADEQALQAFGFRLSDSLRFADLYSRERSLHAEFATAYVESLQSQAVAAGASKEEQQTLRANEPFIFAFSVGPPLEQESNGKFAESLGMEVEAFEALVRSMSTPVGSQNLHSPSEDNTLRTRPVIGLSTGHWLWCRPIDFVHSSLDWAAELCAATPRALAALDKARQHVAEVLPSELLRQVFGDRVVSNARYPTAEAPAEVDTIVVLPRATIVLESKGGRFSPAGRRGAPGRVSRHAQDLIERAADQNARTHRAILDGSPFGARHQEVEPDPQSEVISMVVTLDRIDPFSTRLGLPSSGDPAQKSWVLALADLILMVEVLPDPSDFFAYAQHRTEMVREGLTRVFVETDALGAWCVDRLTKLDRVPLEISPGSGPLKMLSTTSSWMNDYFSAQAFVRLELAEEGVAGLEAHRDAVQTRTRPTTGVPVEVLDGLSRLLETNHPLWPARCHDALSVSPKAWRQLDRLLRRLADVRPRSGGRSARQELRKATSGFRVDGKCPVRVVLDSGALRNEGEYVEVLPSTSPVVRVENGGPLAR